MQQKLPLSIEAPAPSPPPRRARPERDWRIDARTRRTGLQGVARARAALEGDRRTTRPSISTGSGQPDAA